MKNKRGTRIGIVTAGGDCPGLNACIRAIVRSSLAAGYWELFGIRRGYEGLIEGDFIPLDSRSVSGIINRGGTFLRTARSQTFATTEGMRKAARQLDSKGIGAMIVIGGNGSLRGATEFSRYTRARIIGIPKTIDNDVGGTDFSIGFDTAVNTAVEAIDKIRDTATSHERIFLVEVMGRDRGFLALSVGIASGAEEILVPEIPLDLEGLHRRLTEGARYGKKSSIVIVAEGCQITGGSPLGQDAPGGHGGVAFKIARRLESWSGYQVRVSVLGYQQRGGVPSAFDRILATRFGQTAVEAVIQGQKNKMTSWHDGKVRLCEIQRAWKDKRHLDPKLLTLARTMSH
jgi:6-phosphofructokinase 1